MKLATQYKIGLGAFALFATLTSNGVAYAQGDKTGGGGDALVCQENGKTKYYLLDVYEAKLNGQILDLSSEKLSIRDKIILAQERFSDLDSTRADAYASEALKMLEDIEAQEKGKSAPNGLVALTPQELKDIDDANEIFTFAANCKKRQLVRQEKPTGPRDPFYTIDQNYWSRLDADQKVATLYHEAIYKEMRENGATMSKGARALNGMIMSGVIQNIKSGEYRAFLKTQGLGTYQYAGFETKNKDVSLDSKGEITSIEGKQIYTFGNLKLVVQDPQFSNRQFRSAKVLSTFDLDANKTQITTNTVREKDYKEYPYGTGRLQGSTIEINADGSITLRNLTKNDDGGSMTLTLDSTGKVLSRQETGFYDKPISIEMNDALSDLFRCTRKLVQKSKNTELAETLLQAARTAVTQQDTNTVQNLNTDCKKQSTSVKAEISSDVQTIVNSIAKPKAEECVGKALTVSAAALFGVKVGITSMTCQFSDGTRHVYFGPHLGAILGGMGADVMAGKFTLEGDQNIGKGGALISSSRDGIGMLLVKIPDSLKGPQQQQYESDTQRGLSIDESEQAGLGFIMAMDAEEVIPTIKLFRKKDRYDNLISKLVHGIEVQK